MARRVLFVAVGQSNWQGAGANENGVSVRRRSVITGLTDPFPGCNNINQGGSCFPQLIDLCAQRGVNLDVLNYVIGGASVWHYTGRVGATVTGGSAATPAAQGYMSPVGLSGGTGTCVEGNTDFDPFSLLSRTRAAIAARRAAGSYDAVIGYWCNGESDSSSSAASYSAALQSVANYMLASGCGAHFIGLTSKQASASAGDFDLLAQGIDLAVAAVPRTIKGHSMWAKFGSNAPLYAESDGTTYVHMTIRGQDVQAALVNDVLRANGY